MNYAKVLFARCREKFLSLEIPSRGILYYGLDLENELACTFWESNKIPWVF